MTTTRVTLAYPWQGPDGVNHRADTTVSVERAIGEDLILTGRARRATTDADTGAGNDQQEGSDR